MNVMALWFWAGIGNPRNSVLESPKLLKSHAIPVTAAIPGPSYVASFSQAMILQRSNYLVDELITHCRSSLRISCIYDVKEPVVPAP